MTLDEIKQALAEGKTVCYSNEGYQVIVDCKGQYMIRCKYNNSVIGLTWADNVTLNGTPDLFYIVKEA